MTPLKNKLQISSCFIGIVLCSLVYADERVRTVGVYGMIEDPGIYKISDDQNFLAVILLAGGVSRFWSGQAMIRRKSGDGIHVYEVNLWELLERYQDFPLQEKDIVLFPHQDWAKKYVENPESVNNQIRRIIKKLNEAKAEPDDSDDRVNSPENPKNQPDG